MSHKNHMTKKRTARKMESKAAWVDSSPASSLMGFTLCLHTNYCWIRIWCYSAVRGEAQQAVSLPEVVPVVAHFAVPVLANGDAVGVAYADAAVALGR